MFFKGMAGLGPAQSRKCLYGAPGAGYSASVARRRECASEMICLRQFPAPGADPMSEDERQQQVRTADVGVHPNLEASQGNELAIIGLLHRAKGLELH